MSTSPPAPRAAARIALGAAALVGASLTLVAAASPAAAVTNAVSTSTNINATTGLGPGGGNGSCLNGGPGAATEDVVNCNLYGAKEDVWLSGLPTTLADGDYFFAVLVPGGQADPNDGSADNLSDDFDSAENRRFSLSGGVVTKFPGTVGHPVENGKIQLYDYADTTNPGGVYILAVCAYTGEEVDASDCKYDAFKVDEDGTDEPAEDADPLTVVKDAEGSYTTTYTWTIDKSVDKTEVKQVGGNVTFNYTADLQRSAGVVSDVGVSGTIKVFNPNPDPVLGVDVTDTLSDGTECTVTDGTDATIPAATDAETQGEASFAYECELGSLPSGPLDNTATATWDDQAVGDAFLPGGSASFTFSQREGAGDPPFIGFTNNEVDECVSVTDVFDGGTPTTLAAELCADDEIDYSVTVPAPQYGCVSYDNTATFTSTDHYTVTGSDSQTVTVCGPVYTGARTIGFWQNKNGQDVIKSGGSTSGVCNVTTFLRGYAPFQDLAANATCTQAASYVSNIIKAANSSGASMNAMLKAQMLATALDVFYTGPHGNVGKARNFLPLSNLGGTVIDLTKVCSSPGSCTSYQNVSGAFGGAASMSVADMLQFAAGQSNAGGSLWYGNVKATQEKAKNAFDAVNNQVAFAG